MKKTLYIVAILSIFNFDFSISHAQEDNAYNESVLVRGSYRPTLEQAEKITFPAVVTDTLGRMSHSFLYDIESSRLKVRYEPARIKAARIVGEPATKLYNNYFRLGFGNYLSPLADFYWSSLRDKKKTYGIRFNHQSSWGKLDEHGENQFGITGITLFGKYIVDDLLQLSSDLSYEHDHNLYYGFTDDTLFSRLGKTRDSIYLHDYRIGYNVATFNFGIRNMELDANKLGYSANLRLSDLWATWGQNEFNLNLAGDIHYGFNIRNQYKGVAYLHAEWDGYGHRFHSADEMPLGFKPSPIPADTSRGSRNIVKFNPYADFMFNGLQFHAGFTVGWDGFTADTTVIFRFFPDVVVSKKFLGDAMVLSFGATGGFTANCWDVIRRINPYVAPDAEQRATRHYDFMGHMRWSISKKLEANAEIGYVLSQDDLTFTLDTNYALDNVYRPLYFNNNRFTLGADLSFVNDEMLTLRAGGHYYSYTNIETLAAGGMHYPAKYALYRPDWDVLVSGDLNYNDKVLFHVEFLLQGQMHGDSDFTIPMRFGVNSVIEYRHNRALSFFLKMDNLAFQRYYYWTNYPSQRGLFILGLTYTIPHK
jgi:hypothetical protein